MHTPTSPSIPVTLVGRERELGLLRERLNAAFAGQGSLVLIGGEAGIGKTALAEAICREAEQQHALTLIGRCYDLTETPPYGPWVNLFERYQPAPNLPPHPGAFAEPSTVGVVASQAVLFRQVLDFFKVLVSTCPVVLLLDDVHWSDPTSFDLLRFLAQSIPTMSMVIVVTYRSDELTRRHPLYTLLPTLVHESAATRLDLRPLRAEDIGVLVHARYRLPDADAVQLVAYLNNRSEGNSFFLGELLRTLEEEGVLRETETGWARGAFAGVRMPPLLREVIDGRLARLGEDAHRLLAVAAVIGQDVSLSLWTTVAQVSEETLLLAVERAMDAHLFAQTLENERVHFNHALIREALYVGTSPVQRRIWHRQVGEALVTGANPDPDAVAYHFQQAGDGRAVEWLVQAGKRAELACAWLTAADRFETALSVMDHAEANAGRRGWLLFSVARMRRYTDPRHGIRCLEEAERFAITAHDRLLAAHAVYQRGLLRCIAGDIQQGITELEAGILARREIGADGLARQAELSQDLRFEDDDGSDTLLLWLATAGRYAAARALGEQLHDHTADTYRGLGLTYAALGLPEEARQAFAHAREAYHRIGNHFNGGSSAGYELLWVVLPYQTDQIAERGILAATIAAAWEQASGAVHDDLRHLARLPLDVLEGQWKAVHEAGRLQADVLQWLRWSVCGQVAYWQGDTETAWAMVREVLPDGPQSEPGNCRFLVALPLLRLAATLSLDANNSSAARTWLEAHDRWLAWSGTVLGQAEGQMEWARYCRAIGDEATAYTRARQACTHATSPRQPLAQLAAHRLLGELDASAGCLTDAAHHFDAALSLADTCATPYERALTLLARAQLSAAVGDEGEALTLLDEVREICRILGAAPALARADVLAARLAIGMPPPSPSSGSLTNREVEVLRLLAGGSTIRQIAADLFLSPRTVERHITTIYRKIDARGRVDATAYALRNGLATASRHDS